MKRSALVISVTALVIAAFVGLLHGTGALLVPEMWVFLLIGRSEVPKIPGGFWQYPLLLVIAAAVAWFTIQNTRRNRTGWVVVALIAELLALMWVCALYRAAFQPLPYILAAVLSYIAITAYLAFQKRRGYSFGAFEGRLSPEEVAKFRSGEHTFNGKAGNLEVTVVVCDIAHKYDLADTAEPQAIAQTTENFNQCATHLFLSAGAYLYSSDGEGVVAVFGFPGGGTDHAEKAVRVAFDLTRTFAASGQSSNGENPLTVGAHIGVSSGPVVAASIAGNREILIMGESLELARRFCVANRFYGSRILIGPRTFELASNSFVARPIDFLSGVSSQERHEIYEPLAVTADAPSELVARRDSFWNGVVLYREKRWAEAYSEFQKARGPGEEEDAPLNIYLRRLEPLALHLTESPAEDRF